MTFKKIKTIVKIFTLKFWDKYYWIKDLQISIVFQTIYAIDYEINTFTIY